MRGAGGTDGGTVTFLLGLAMMVVGGYLLLNSIIVRPAFGMGMAAFRVGGVPVTTGMILVPFAFGVALIFYRGASKFGWFLAIGSVLAMVGGVIANLTIQFAALSIFDILIIFLLFFGGLGLFLRSLLES